MAPFPKDLRFSIRSLRRNPGFTATAVLALAFGIGSVTTTFSFINAYLGRPLPFHEPDRLVHLWETDRRRGWDTLRTSLPNFQDWTDYNDVFEELAVFNYTSEDLTGGERPERVSAGRSSANIFRLLGVEPQLGRGFAPGEDRPGNADVVLISDSFWESRFNRDPNVLRKTLEVNRRPHVVIGVMPAGFIFPLPTTQIWLPHVLDPSRAPRGNGNLQAVGRLKPGISLSQAQADMDRVATLLMEKHPESNADRGVNVVPLRSALNFADEIMRVMSVVLTIANLFVLLLVCANVSSLLLGRGLNRSHETAIRAALGASRFRLVRHFMTESLTLAAAGGAVGLLLAVWFCDLIAGLIPDDIYRVGRMSVDGEAALFTAGVSLATAFFFGLAPAFRSSRADLNETLKESGSSVTASRATSRLQNLLVSVEIGIALTLLVGASLMMQSLLRLRQVDPGFIPERVLTMKIILPDDKYAEESQRRSFHREVLNGIGALPGIVDAATVNHLPLNHEMQRVDFRLPGQAAQSGAQPATATLVYVSPGYFSAMGVALISGRTFLPADDENSPPAAVVNQNLATRLVGAGGDPLDMELLLEGSPRRYRIVGVVADTAHWDLTEGPQPQVYLSQFQAPRSYFRIVAKTAKDPLGAAPSVRSAVWSVDDALPITEIRSMEQVLSEFLLPQRMISNMMWLFSLGAIVLASIGIYGLMAFFVSQRLHEIGVRMTLGASRSDVLKLVLGRGLRLTLVGLAAGLAAAYGLSRLLTGILFDVQPVNFWSFLGVPAILAAIALFSCWIPARRAAAVDPVQALRYE